MFLISKFVYEAMGKSKLHATSAYLKIINYLPENHKQTFYKFRYGAVDEKGAVGAVVPITIKRGSYVSIWSMEGFELSERVVAVFGHSSDLFIRGLELIHSPFIDPTFKGSLQLIVKNFSDKDLILTPGEIVGKIMFFDISDTILSAEDLLNEVQRNTQNQFRQNAIHEISEMLGKISKIA